MSEVSEIVETVALALASANEDAGLKGNGAQDRSVEARAKNIIECGYVEEGDPQGWTADYNLDAAAMIYMEQRGGPDDCEMPLSYYGDGLRHSYLASKVLPSNLYIEFVNAALAVVVRD